MKKTIFMVCIISLILLVSACKGTQTEKDVTNTTDLVSFLQTVELPKNLTISFDAANVKSTSSAKIYTANFLSLEAETVAKELLNKPIVDEKAMAEGMWFQAEDESLTEYLTVLDGGKSFGTDSGVNGGLYYSVFVKGKPVVDFTSVISGEVGPPSINEQLNKSLLRSDYSSHADLSFQSYEEALNTVKRQLMTVGIPTIELGETYSLDLNTIQAHYDLYTKESQDQQEHISWTKDDEAYLFHFRQMIDQIPVVNVPWEWGKGAATGADGNIMKFPIIDATYTHDGIINIRASGIYDIDAAKAGEEKPLISAAEAMQVMFKEYQGLLLDEGTEISSAELSYVSVPEDKSYQLIPAWVFGVAKPTVWIDPESKSELPYNNYSEYVVNAITGEKMSGMR